MKRYNGKLQISFKNKQLLCKKKVNSCPQVTILSIELQENFLSKENEKHFWGKAELQADGCKYNQLIISLINSSFEAHSLSANLC